MTPADKRVEAWLALEIAKNRARLTKERRSAPRGDRTRWLAEVNELEKLAEQRPR